jgi:PAS domain S-box-containing protein
MSQLLPEGAAMVEALRRDGRIPATETVLAGATGERIPALFTAAALSGTVAGGASGGPGGFVCAAQDITAWKAAQRELRRMSKVFMDAADPILVLDGEARIQGANAEAERVYGWSREELVGQSMAALIPPNRRDGFHRWFERSLAGGGVRNAETVQVTRDGTSIPVLLTLSLLTDEAGEPAGVAAIAKDISQLRRQQQELELLAGRLITAQEEERGRLARELHDDLTQRLAALAIEAGQRGWDGMKERIARLSEDVHGLSRRLHPATLDDLGLAAAVEGECRGFFERGGAPVDFTCEGECDSVSKSTQLAAYRIVQEGLRNIARHAGAEEVFVRLRRVGAWLELEIRDAGRGFDTGSADWRKGLGLASMEERARLAGGEFRVRSRIGEGTVIEVRLPV